MAYPDPVVRMWVGGQWEDITNDVYLRDRISITRGRADRAGRPSPGRCRFTLKNTEEVRAKYSPVNPLGEWYGLFDVDTPVQISVTPNGTEFYRFTGRIPEFSLERHHTDNDRWITVEAYGLLYYLQNNEPPAYDALRRHITQYQPLAYWSLTDGRDAIQGTEVITGGQPMRAVGTDGSFFQGQPGWGQGSLAPWLDSVVQLPANTEGKLTASVRPVQVTAWAADYYRSGPGGQDDDLAVFNDGDGSNARPLVGWIIAANSATSEVRLDVLVENDSGISVSALWLTGPTPSLFDESPHHFRITTSANGADTDWGFYIDGVEIATGTETVLHRPASRFRYRWGAFGSMTEAASLGHITYWGETWPDADLTWKAVNGHVRERAGRRIERVCAEEGITLRVVGDLDETPLMGPQQPGAPLSLLEAAVDVDAGGTLNEAVDEDALEYRTTRARCNQGVV